MIEVPAEVWCPECPKAAAVHVASNGPAGWRDYGWFCEDHAAARYTEIGVPYVHYLDHEGDCANSAYGLGSNGEGGPCQPCSERLVARWWLLQVCLSCLGTNEAHRPGCAVSADDFGEYDGGAPEPTARPDWPVDHEEGE